MKSIEQMALEAYPELIDTTTDYYLSDSIDMNFESRNAYIQGCKDVLALFDEEIDHHRCPEHGYFCDCLDDIIIALKGDEL
jgi:hypothetical protein